MIRVAASVARVPVLLLALLPFAGEPALGAARPAPASRVTSDPLAFRHRKGELLVRFARTATPAAVARAHAAAGATPRRRFVTVDRLALVHLPPDRSERGAIEAYRKDPAVLYAEPNYEVETTVVPDDPLFARSDSEMWKA